MRRIKGIHTTNDNAALLRLYTPESSPTSLGLLTVMLPSLSWVREQLISPHCFPPQRLCCFKTTLVSVLCSCQLFYLLLFFSADPPTTFEFCVSRHCPSVYWSWNSLMNYMTQSADHTLPITCISTQTRTCFPNWFNFDPYLSPLAPIAASLDITTPFTIIKHRCMPSCCNMASFFLLFSQNGLFASNGLNPFSQNPTPKPPSPPPSPLPTN